MIREEFTIVDPNGFHARPATLTVNAAVKQKCTITIAYDGYEVSMKSLMGLMALGMPYGAHFTLTCEGEGEESAMHTLVKILLEQKLISESSIEKG